MLLVGRDLGIAAAPLYIGISPISLAFPPFSHYHFLAFRIGAMSRSSFRVVTVLQIGIPDRNPVGRDVHHLFVTRLVFGRPLFLLIVADFLV